MRGDWWELPGPASFINEVHDDLLAGRSVVLRLPLRLPDGLRNTLRCKVEQNPLWYWTSIGVVPDSPDPVSLLSERFATNDSQVVHDTRSLVASGTLSGKVIWVDGLDIDTWARWEDFIHAYCSFCKDVDLLDRGLFVLSCMGPVAESPPTSDVALGVHTFRGTVGNLDMLLWIAGALEGSGHSPLERQIRISVASELAGVDPDLGLELVGLTLETLFEPYDYLSKQAAVLAMTDLKHPKWSEGMMDDIDGVECPHVLYLAAVGATGRRTIRQRVWSGQLRILFPWLERARIELLGEIEPLLCLPFNTGFGEITDKYELEIGHIFFQVKNRVDRELRRHMGILMEIRNALAHLEPVSASLFRDLTASAAKQRTGR